MAYNLMDLRRRIIASQPHELKKSGSIVTFGTNIARPMQVTCALTPVQSGSGDPYPPGGGKNKLDDSGLLRGYYGANGGYSGNVNYISYKANLPAGTYTFSSDLDTCYIPRYLIDNTETIVGMTTQKITFTMNADGEFKITIRKSPQSDISSITPHSQIESGSTATAYSPYSNIRPTTGWTGCDVTGAGVNLYDPDLMAKEYVNANAQRPCVKFTKQGTYYIKSLKTGESSGLTYLTVKNADGTYGTAQAVVNGTTVNNREVAITDGQTLIVYGGASSSTTVDTVKGQFADWGIVVSPQDMTTYTAYTGTTIPITWQTEAGTVYGGTMTLNRDGSVTVVEEWIKFVPTSVLIVSTASTGVKYAQITLPYEAPSESSSNRFISSEYKFRVSSAPSDSGWFRLFLLTFLIFDNRFTDKATAESILAEEKPEFCYKLATPLTYTISASALNSLLGVNNVWADAGDVSVKAWGF